MTGFLFILCLNNMCVYVCRPIHTYVNVKGCVCVYVCERNKQNKHCSPLLAWVLLLKEEILCCLWQFLVQFVTFSFCFVFSVRIFCIKKNFFLFDKSLLQYIPVKSILHYLKKNPIFEVRLCNIMDSRNVHHCTCNVTNNFKCTILNM